MKEEKMHELEKYIDMRVSKINEAVGLIFDEMKSRFSFYLARLAKEIKKDGRDRLLDKSED